MTVTHKPLISSFSARSDVPRSGGQEGRLNIFSADGHEAADMDMARFIMALRAKGLRDTSLLSAFEHAPRRAFFPEPLWAYLYGDIALPLPCGEEATSAQGIAHVLNEAGLKRGMRVLEIGTGSGYQTALIALIAGQVISLERCRSLATLARRHLSSIEMSGVEVRLGDGQTPSDCPEGRFDRIIVNGVVEACQPVWLDRLAPGGRIITGLAAGGSPILVSIEPDGSESRERNLGICRLPYLKTGRARII